jgi:HSP20 family molecular chaperone IbpA
MNETKNVVAREGERAPAEARHMALLPPVDVLEDEGGITLFADLPGVSKDKLNVRIDGDTLTLEGEAVVGAPQGMEQVYSEVRVPYYRRGFTLSRELDTSKIEALMKDGVLKLHIPKLEEAKPRRINVRID